MNSWLVTKPERVAQVHTTRRGYATARAGGRVLGVDVGTQSVGLAISDPLRLFAQPVGAYPPNGAIEELRQLAEREGIELAVVGWPLTEEGGEGPATRMVNVFVRRIRKAIRGVRIVRLDEGYSSEEARDRLEGATSKGRIDTLAAGIILQEYLDSTSSSGEEGNVSGQ